MKRVAVVIGSRANYASIRSTLKLLDSSESFSLSIVAMASAVVDRFGQVSDVMTRDGLRPEFLVNNLIQGDSPTVMARSTGLALLDLPNIFDKVSPDFVVTVGDRYETIATALSASYMNIPLVHTMGGEVSGSIDESIRHAITKFANVHCAATGLATKRIIRMGEDPKYVFHTGCPRIDYVKETLEADTNLDAVYLFRQGVGDEFDLNEPFILVSQHGVTTEYGKAGDDMVRSLAAVQRAGLPAFVLWPNPDAGSESIAATVRKWREDGLARNMYFIKNLPPEHYMRLMNRAAALLGNSSSGIREGSYIGTPVVNVGSRQNGRERANNVRDVRATETEIVCALLAQIEHGPYPRSDLYGDGNASSRVLNAIDSVHLTTTQKQLTY